MDGVDLEKALSRTRSKQTRNEPDEILKAFKDLLARDDASEEQIQHRIFKGGGASPQLKLSQLDPRKIYRIEDIKKICTDYRLRFLDSQYFRGAIPYEATVKIKELQRSHQTEIEQFKIMAPAPMFELEYQDKDPLLFIPLGQDRFYLLHKWGNDLHPLRKLVVFPFRTFKSLLASIAGLAAFIVCCIPSSVLMGPYDKSSLGIRVIFFFYLFISLAGLTALYGFSRVKNFNSVLWNSRFND